MTWNYKLNTLCCPQLLLSQQQKEIRPLLISVPRPSVCVCVVMSVGGQKTTPFLVLDRVSGQQPQSDLSVLDMGAAREVC